MHCLWAIRGVIRTDRLQNIKIREDIFTLESIMEVIRQRRLRWFGHVCRVQRDNIVRQAGPPKRGRPWKRWSDQIRNDTGLLLLTAEQHATNRTKKF